MKKILLLIFILFITGCSTRYSVNIKAIQAAKVSDPAIKNIAVLPFKHDTVSQSSQIESVLNNLYIDGHKYFNVVDRKDLKQILKEKKLDYSGLVNVINTKFGIKQVDSIIIGSVNVDKVSTSYFRAKRTDYNSCAEYRTVHYKNGKSSTYCVRHRTYTVPCTKKEYNLQTSIKILKVANAQTIFSKVYNESTFYTHCSDDRFTLPSKEEVNSRLAKYIAQKFIRDIAPHYVNYYVTLLDDLDVDIDDDEKLFNATLKLIKLNRIKKANQILVSLLNKYPNSYVITYDTAITYEALGKLDTAKRLLLKAENLSLKDGKVIEEIENALKRVNHNIQELKRAKKQL